MHEPSPPPLGLYVHVPFCASKCAYCDFASYAGRQADIPRYVDAVVREITRRGAEMGRPNANTIFIGGGTPSLLDEGQITRVMDALFEAFTIERDAEVTCECNPGTLGIHSKTSDGPHPLPLSHRAACGARARGDFGPHPRPLSHRAACGARARGDKTLSFARALREAGINRLSIGAQAMQERLLRLLGRIHDWEQVVDSVEIARQSGFENINLDLMFGLPGQTVAEWRETLEAAIALRPTHVSCYGLIVEEATPMHRDVAAGKLALPVEEVERDMYELARRTLAERGFEQYEISNFARGGYECWHNIGCWTRAPYLGFGAASHSFFDDCRAMNPSGIDAYLASEAPKTEQISKKEARFESLMLGLRMTRGVRDEDFTRMHGMSIREAFGEKLDKPIGEGLLQWRGGALCLTRRGMDLQNSVLVDLM